MGTKLSALTMVISYYFSKFNFRHYTGTFTASRDSRDYMPVPIATHSQLGVDWENYLIKFMRSGSVVQEKWKRLSKQDVDIEHFHRDHSEGVWKAIIGQKGNPGAYPHINAGSEWVRISDRTQSIDVNMGDMGYYMYFVYNSPYEPLTDPERFTPTTQFIMFGPPPPVAMSEDPNCMDKCLKKGGKTCEKICGLFGSKYKKEGGRSRRRRRKRTRKRRKYKKKRTRKRRRKNKRSRKK
jgi:hypothetical protein